VGGSALLGAWRGSSMKNCIVFDAAFLMEWDFNFNNFIKSVLIFYL